MAPQSDPDRLNRARDDAPGLPFAAASVMTAASLAYIALLAVTPMIAVTPFWYDETLFVRLAEQIRNGHWLGGYDHLTLVKGAGYPLWIAGVSRIGVPLNVAQGLVYILAAWLFALALMRMRVRAWVAVAAFVFVLWAPGLFETITGRVLREGLYTPLIALTVSLVAWLLISRDRTLIERLSWAGCLGAAVGWLWITREESITLLPGFGAAALMLLGKAFAEPRTMRWRTLLRDGATISVAVLVACLVVFSVALVNKKRYGVFEVSEVRQSAFIAAYAAIARVRVDAPMRYVALSPKTRERLYEVSPAFRELRPHLEGYALKWARYTCAEERIDPCDGNYRSNNFQWALRDAAALAGHYRSAPDARAYYKRLAGEINAACTDGTLNSLSKRHTMAPPFQWPYVEATLTTAWATLGIAVRDDAFPPLHRYSLGDGAGLAWYRRVTRAEFFPFRPSLVITGHVRHSGKHSVAITIDAGDGHATVTRIDRMAADQDNVGIFTVETDCPIAACDLVASAADGTRIRVPLAQILADTKHERDGLLLAFTAKTGFPYDLATYGRTALLRAITPGWRLTYRYLLPIAIGVGFACYFASALLAVSRRRVSDLFILTTMVLMLYGSRLALLAYIKVTAHETWHYYYLSPLYPLGALFGALSIVGGAQDVRRELRRRRHRSAVSRAEAK